MKRLGPLELLAVGVIVGLLVLRWFSAQDANDSRAESARLRATVDSLTAARDSVSEWAAATLAAQDSARAVERARAQRVIVRTDTVRVAAEAVLAMPTPTIDTLRTTIRTLLRSNGELSTLFAEHIANDTVETRKRDAVWQTRVDAEVKVSNWLRALQRDTERRLTAVERRAKRDRLLWGAAGALAGWALKP